MKAGASSASRAPPEAAPGAAPPRKAPPRKAPLAQGSGGRAAAAPRFRRRGAAQQSCRPPPLGGRGRENGGGGGGGERLRWGDVTPGWGGGRTAGWKIFSLAPPARAQPRSAPRRRVSPYPVLRAEALWNVLYF